jgi:DNA ligase D-like protein (predicted 3'-phosphoesterase)
VQGVGFRDVTVGRARELGVMGWVRNEPDGVVGVHLEGPTAAVDELVAYLREAPPPARVSAVEIESVAVEGHEQFAIRGVSAGGFVVREETAGARHFDLCLEVDGAPRRWAIPKGPSLDPAVKRLAVEVAEDSAKDDVLASSPAASRPIVWDRGSYEQGGRVAWPDALARGHAVFVLHGEKLRGGFALQRTGAAAEPRWLLVKRRDDCARPGSDIVAERPDAVGP